MRAEAVECRAGVRSIGGRGRASDEGHQETGGGDADVRNGVRTVVRGGAGLAMVRRLPLRVEAYAEAHAGWMFRPCARR